MPFPPAGPRKASSSRRKRNTEILTDTPVKEAMEEKKAAPKKLKRNQHEGDKKFEGRWGNKKHMRILNALCARNGFLIQDQERIGRPALFAVCGPTLRVPLVVLVVPCTHATIVSRANMYVSLEKKLRNKLYN